MQHHKQGTRKFLLLESIRGSTALYVMIVHLLPSLHNIPNYIIVLFKFGKEAVIIFFILSGFVVHYSNKNTNSFKPYFIKRFKRIYGPVVVIFVITTFLSYNIHHSFIKVSLWELLGNILMLQYFKGAQPGMWFDCYLGNSPLWSLSYEWWFYMLYYPILKYIKTSKLTFVFFFSLTNWFLFLLTPNPISLIFSYFVIWWSGVELANLYVTNSLSDIKKVANVLVVNLFMVLVSLIPFLYFKEPLVMGYFPVSNTRYFFASFLFILIGFIWHKHKWVYFDKLFGIFALISPISFGIYITHYPIFFMLKISIKNIFLESLIKIMIILFISYIIEIILQPYINRILFRPKQTYG